MISVRRATENDAEALVSLNNVFNGAGVTADHAKNSLAQTNELIALACMNDEAIGFACAQYFKSFCYEELLGELTEMYVKMSARRKGAAALLISFLERELRSRGVKTVKVLTGKHNQPAIHVYEKSKYIRDDDLVLYKVL